MTEERLSEYQKGIKLHKANIILIDCANSIGFGQILNVNKKDSQFSSFLAFAWLTNM